MRQIVTSQRTMANYAIPQPLPDVTSNDKNEREVAVIIRQQGAKDINMVA